MLHCDGAPGLRRFPGVFHMHAGNPHTTTPRRPPVAGEALSRFSVSKMAFIRVVMGMRSPLDSVSTRLSSSTCGWVAGGGRGLGLLGNAPHARGGPRSARGHGSPTHRVEVFDPDGVHRAIHHDPGVLVLGFGRPPPQHSKHAVRPLPCAAWYPVGGGGVCWHGRCGALPAACPVLLPCRPPAPYCSCRPRPARVH